MLRLDSNLVLTMINLIIFFLLMRHFLIKPVTDIMEKRKQMIEDDIRDAGKEQEKALLLKKQYEEALSGAREESQTLIERAKENAKQEYSRIVKDADVQAGKILKTARETIEQEREKTIKDMKTEVAGLAVDAARKIVAEQMKENGGQGMYDQFLEEAGEAYDSREK